MRVCWISTASKKDGRERKKWTYNENGQQDSEKNAGGGSIDSDKVQKNI